MVKIWATVVTTSSYLVGVLTLDYSLKQTNTKYDLVVFYTKSLLNNDPWVVDELQRRNIQVKLIDELKISENIFVAEKRFLETFTKLNAYKLIEYERIGMLDADMLVRANIDELLEMHLPKDSIAASHACVCNPKKKTSYPANWSVENCAYSQQNVDEAQKVGYDCKFGVGMLNGGMIVFEPSLKIHKRIIDELISNGTKPLLFADQELLSNVFKNTWKPLPYIYNALKTLRNCHANIWKDEHVKIVHYILEKPWDTTPQTNSVEDNDEYAILNGWWWEMNERRIQDEKKNKML
jgi:lipopolysaccharide biosynthesis glycosyltransferase